MTNEEFERRRFVARAAIPESWAVAVEHNGEPILTIASNMLSGKPELSAEDERIIVTAAEHLLSFIGRSYTIMHTEKAPFLVDD